MKEAKKSQAAAAGGPGGLRVSKLLNDFRNFSKLCRIRLKSLLFSKSSNFV